MDNNDIAGALGKLLEDPAALAKAMSIASSLMGNMSEVQNDAPGPSDIPDTSVENTAPQANTNASINSDGAPSIAAMAQLLGGGGAKGDPRCALLYALKPYMGHGRAEKIDTLVNMLRLADLAGGMLGGKLF